MSHRPLSKFVLRTPVLPFHVLARWTGRETLRQLVEDPTIREALYVASPELDAQIAAWQREPDSAQSSGVERALVRYVSRMASRCTPFGLFAAVSVGAVADDRTNLEVRTRAAATRHTRLDNDLLFALCSDLGRDKTVRRHLRYRPNQSLYAAAGRLRYAEARLAGPVRAYHLVAVDRSDYLAALLDRAQPGATLGELADVLCADPDISRDEAETFVDEVIDAQLLVAELQPQVTGAEPTAGIVATLERAGLPHLAAPLRAADEALAVIDASAPGVAADAYRAIEKQLAAGVPTKVEPSRLFQVDLFKPAPAATLGGAVLDELQRGIALLHGLTPGGGDPVWARFREKFMTRYETREVPLVEVLDEEVGIGFGDAPVGVGAAPLLADLAFGGRGGAQRTVPMDRRELHLLQLITHAVRTNTLEVELTDDDVEQLSSKSALPLADVITAGAVVIGDSPDTVAAGNFQLRISHATGGANLLGRFCHGSQEVAELTAEALRAEEALRPDAIFAEIVHLPEGRIGNVLLRPVLRSHEIAFLGTSGAADDRQIPITDLTVSVDGDRVVLRSRTLGKEVIPRMTTAHNYSSRSLAIYRFLCSHALQNVGGAYWTWGGLEDFPFLPRVRHGKLILSRARWLLTRRDLEPIEAACAGAAKTPDQVRAQRAKVLAAVAAVRARLGLPRWVVIGDGDNELPVDLENELMVDSAAHLIKNRPAVTLFELLPAADQLCTHSPEGTFTHELFVLFRREAEPRTSQPFALAPASSADRAERRFLPGSPWLYLKLYTGTATADALLRDALAPAIQAAVANGIADSWFFIRYADPDWHLRLRFAGDPTALASQLLPFLHHQLAPACASGLLWRVVLDTYEREVERYGGPHAIALAERLFHADSDAALAIIAACQGDAGTQAAWRLALRGIDQLLDDLGLALPDKLALMTRARDSFGAELGMTTAFQKQLGEKYRAHQKEIAALLEAPAHASDHPFAPALAAFATRSERIRPIAGELRALAEQRALVTPFDSIVLSFVHMHVNRMIRTSQRPHELVLYDLLRRYYDGVLARAKRAPKPVKAVA
jgi:class I lanthipeptide synthase